jgi:pilus assembly protein Flp/PilA
MLKYYVKASDLLQRLRDDKDGVVSFEYLIVAACIVAAVAFAFGTTGAGSIGAGLKTGITAIVAALTAAVAAA